MKVRKLELFEKYPDIVSIENLMEMLHLGKSKVYNLLQNNQIRHVRVGRKYIIPKLSVVGFLNESCYTTKQIIDGKPIHLVPKGVVV